MIPGTFGETPADGFPKRVDATAIVLTVKIFFLGDPLHLFLSAVKPPVVIPINEPRE